MCPAPIVVPDPGFPKKAMCVVPAKAGTHTEFAPGVNQLYH